MFKKIFYFTFRGFCLFFIVLFVPTLFAARKTPQPSQFSRYPIHVDIAGYWMNAGNQNSAFLGDLFVPLINPNPNRLLYSSIRAYDPEGSSFEMNFLLGFRGLYGKERQTLFGLYSSFDRLRSSTKNYFSQLTFGTEFWHKQLFFGANGYLIVGKNRYNDPAFNSAALTSPNAQGYQNIIYAPGFERALDGFDAELGMEVYPGLVFYGGGYHFYQSDVPNMSGPKGGATYTLYAKRKRPLLGLFDRIRLESQIGYDDIRKTHWSLGLRFTLAFTRNFGALSGMERHMVDPVRRDLDIVAQEYNGPQKILKEEGSPVNVLVVSSGDELTNNINTKNLAVIGIDGSIQPPSGDISITRTNPLVISGGMCPFVAEGENYSVRVGSGGEIDGSLNSSNLLSVETGAPLTIENITLTVQDGYKSVTTENSTDLFNLTIRNNVVNGRLWFYTNVSSLTDSSQLSLTNNNVEIGDINAASGDDAAIGILADGADVTLDVSAFSGNNVTVGSISNSAAADDLGGIVNSANSDAILNFNGDFVENVVNVNGNITNLYGASMGGIINGAGALGGTGEIHFRGNFSDNLVNISGNINVAGTGVPVVGGIVNHAILNPGGALIFHQNFNGNIVNISGSTITAANYYTGGIINVCAFNGTCEYRGSFSGNSVTINVTTINQTVGFGGIINLAHGAVNGLIFSGGFSNNNVTINVDNLLNTGNNSRMGAGIFNEINNANGTATINFNGGFESNVVEINNSTAVQNQSNAQFGGILHYLQGTGVSNLSFESYESDTVTIGDLNQGSNTSTRTGGWAFINIAGTSTITIDGSSVSSVGDISTTNSVTHGTLTGGAVDKLFYTAP